MAHHAHVRPVHCENLQRRLNPDLPEIDCNVLPLVRDCECGDVSRRRIGPPDWRPSAPTGPGDAVRNPAQVSFWLLEPAADAAMTYFYAQLFATDIPIRSCSRPPRMCSAGASSRPSAISPLPKRASRTATASCRTFRNSAARTGFGVRERHYKVFRRAADPARATQPERPSQSDPARATQPERPSQSDPARATQPERPSHSDQGTPAKAPSPADTGRRTRRSAARRLRPPPCRKSTSPARPAAPSRPAWGS